MLPAVMARSGGVEIQCMLCTSGFAGDVMFSYYTDPLASYGR